LLSEDEAAAAAASVASAVTSSGQPPPASTTAVTREELLRLFILKLDEEANYFQVSASPEEELCDCQKCQVFVINYNKLKYLKG
jgi:hypothetical protein